LIRRIFLSAALTAIAFAGCATAIPHLSQQQLSWAQAKWPGLDSEALEHGRSLYVNRCSACHEAPGPTDFDPATLIGEMADRAKLTKEEQQLVIQFVETVRAQGPVAQSVEPAPHVAGR